MPGKGSSQHQQASSATKSRARKRNVESTLRAHEIPQPSEIVLTLHAISHRFDIGLTPLTGLHKLSKLPGGLTWLPTGFTARVHIGFNTPQRGC